MALITILFIAGFIVYLSSQSNRVKRLEKELSALREKLEKLSPGSFEAEEEEPEEAPSEPSIPAGPSETVQSPPPPTPEELRAFLKLGRLPPVEPPPPPAPEPVMSAAVNQPLADEGASAPAIDWELFAGIKLFAWIGGFALFLGACFFVKYSIDHGLLSPMIRITLSFILGGACIGGGLYLKNSRFIVMAGTLCAAGVAILYADIFAASAIYHFINSGAAFMLMSLVTAASFLLSVRTDSKYVALLGLIGFPYAAAFVHRGGQAVRPFRLYPAPGYWHCRYRFPDRLDFFYPARPYRDGCYGNRLVR